MRLEALTGLSDSQRAELHRRAAERLGTDAITDPGVRPSALDLAGSIDLVCVLLRTNLTQDQAAALFGVSQPTCLASVGSAAQPDRRCPVRPGAHRA